MTYNYLGDYMSFIYLFLIGILIGTAMIIPGVSGSVIAVIFGVYDKSITALTNLFKNFKKNIIYLFILGSGILTGAIWFSNVMMFLYEKHEIITKFSFIGLILGGIPFLIQHVFIPVIYAPRLAAALIKHKLDEMRIKEKVKIVEYTENDFIKIGNSFTVQFFQVTHSIPDSFGICVDTNEGRIVTTGDFKIDLTPVGPDINLGKMARLGCEGVDLLLSE